MLYAAGLGVAARAVIKAIRAAMRGGKRFRGQRQLAKAGPKIPKVTKIPNAVAMKVAIAKGGKATTRIDDLYVPAPQTAAVGAGVPAIELANAIDTDLLLSRANRTRDLQGLSYDKVANATESMTEVIRASVPLGPQLRHPLKSHRPDERIEIEQHGGEKAKQRVAQFPLVRIKKGGSVKAAKLAKITVTDKPQPRDYRLHNGVHVDSRLKTVSSYILSNPVFRGKYISTSIHEDIYGRSWEMAAVHAAIAQPGVYTGMIRSQDANLVKFDSVDHEDIKSKLGVVINSKSKPVARI